MDPDYLLATAVQQLESTYLGGEAVPRARHFMCGTTAGCNGHLHFHDGGISLRPTMASMERPLNWHPGPDDPWRPKIKAIYDRLLDVSPGNFIVTRPDQYPHVDLLNMLRGNEDMLLDMAINPEQCKARLREIREPMLENTDYFRQHIDARQGNVGCVSWTGVWCRDFFLCSQADVAAAISPQMFEDIVLPELDWQAERFGCLMYYHTCGYLQHQDLCLSRPYMRVIQYSRNPREPCHTPEHVAFFRKAQESGRCLDLGSATVDDAEFLIRHLRPEGLFVSIRVATIAEADEILDKATKWAGTHVHRTPQVDPQQEGRLWR